MNPDLILKTSDNQSLAVYTRGNPLMPPVIVLHGGPGGQITEQSFEPFNLDKWYVIAFDQRGCGSSLPFATLTNNTVDSGVCDIELVRIHFKIDSWIVYGGSYGSTLALAYAIKHKNRVTKLVLRGVFLGRDEDIHWLYQEGASYFFPYEHEQFKSLISENKRQDLVGAYYEIFTSDDEEAKLNAAKAWSDWEMSVVTLLPRKDLGNAVTQKDISLATLECHFFANHMFWDSDQYIVDNLSHIKDIPTYIVHGRYDVDCRLNGAYLVKEALDQCELIIAEASGHSSAEPNIMNALKEIFAKLEK